MRTVLLLSALLVPTSLFAAGSSSPTPPKQTKTTIECSEGMVYDETTKECVAPQESRLDDDTLYGAAREFAHAGQFDHAQEALAAMERQDGRYMTYMGFTERKLGRYQSAMAYYQIALEMDPDNILARSYMGQAFVEQGDTAKAKLQLAEINARGGKGTWPAFSLRKAIQSGAGYSY